RGVLLGVLQERLAIGRPAAGAGDDQARRQLWIADAEGERDAAAHRETADVRARDAEVLHQAAEVVHEDLDGVCGLLRDLGRRIAAVVPRHHAVAPREVPDLRLPGAEVCAALVAPAERKAPTRLLAVGV